MKTQAEFLFGDVLWAYLRLRSLDKRDNILPRLHQEVEAEAREEDGARAWESENTDYYYE